MFVKFIMKLFKNNERLYNFARQVYRVFSISGESCPLVYNCRNYTQNKYVRRFLKFLVTPIYALKYFHVRDVPNRKGLAFVLIAKNEAAYIEEWINFHVKQGVSHFIIYDNESTDNFHEVLKPYISSGLVTYNVIKGKIRQMDAYNMVLVNYGKNFKYMGFIDADEFVFIRKSTYGGGGIYEFLEGFMNEHPKAGGIAINWCTFGSSGHEAKPEGGVLENYTMRAEDNFSGNYWVKTIFDPEKILALDNPHNPACRIGFYILDETGGKAFNAVTQEVHFEKIRVNHYRIKSKQDFLAKIQRGNVHIFSEISMKYFYSYDKNDIHDTEILSRA